MTRPAFSICLCPDSRLLQTRLETLLCAHPPATDGAWQKLLFWADEGLGPAFWQNLTQQGLFALPKTLVLRRAESLPADTLNKELGPALMALVPRKGAASSSSPSPSSSPPPTLPSPLIWPIICLEVAFERGQPKIPAHIQRLAFYEEARARNWLDVTPPLAGAALARFIALEAAGRGLKLNDAELAALAAALPPDAAAVSAEVAKLALMAGPDGKLPEGAALTSGASRELNIFEMLRLVQQNSNAPAVWRRILEDRLQGENMVFAFIAILLREARLLWQSLHGGAAGLPAQAAMQKKISAQSLGPAGVARIWELALQAEKGIKSGERNPDQAFEMLAADLFVLFRGRR